MELLNRETFQKWVNKWTKEQTPIKGNKTRKKKGSKSKQKTTLKNAKLHNMKLQEEKLSNLKPKPITSSTKQVMQPKTWKNTKLRRGLSCFCNYLLQDSSGLNSVQSHRHPLLTKWT